jgi:hypothetical protein
LRFRAITSVVNRYYDPSTDQFVSIDPDVAGTDQPYVFSNDNPLNSVDPLGMMPSFGLNETDAQTSKAFKAFSAVEVKAENETLQTLEAQMNSTESRDQKQLNQLNPQDQNVLPGSAAGIRDENAFNAALLGDLTQLGNLGLKVAQVANDTYTLYQDAGEVKAATNAYANAAADLEPLIGTGTADEAATEAQLGDAADYLFDSVVVYQSDVEGVASGGSLLPIILCLLICD